jgi:hypothetical protein
MQSGKHGCWFNHPTLQQSMSCLYSRAQHPAGYVVLCVGCLRLDMSWGRKHLSPAAPTPDAPTPPSACAVVVSATTLQMIMTT